MYWRQTRLALLVIVSLAGTTLPARAQEASPPGPGIMAEGSAPQFQTVCVNEWVPEIYQRIRTVYQPEKRIKAYTAYRWECDKETGARICVPYQATRTVCVYVPRQETVTCIRTVCHTVHKQVPCAAD
jgi:hypothetical protein